MARVQVASQAWGYVVDHRGRPVAGALCEINTTVYAGDTGGTTISAANFKSNAQGFLPGFVDQGRYTFTDPDGDSVQVHAALGLIEAQDEGTDLSPRRKLNFAGAGVSVSPGGERIDVVVSGGGATGPAGPAGVPDGWYDVTDPAFAGGAGGAGVTDDTAAIQAAIDAAKTNGGTVYFPPGVYKVTDTLDLTYTGHSYRVTGAGHPSIHVGGSTLLWVGGAGTGPVMFCGSVSGFELDHLRIVYDNPAFDGDLIDVRRVVGDCTDWHIHDIATFSENAGTARAALVLNQAIIGNIVDCHFGGAQTQILLGDPDYVVSVQIERCTFNNSDDAHILIGSQDAENIVIAGCTFEAGINTTAIRGVQVDQGDAVDHQIYTLVVEGCWFGDSAETPEGTTWIHRLHSVAGYPIVIRNNRFASCGSAGVHLSGDGTWLIEGNSFEDGIAAFRGINTAGNPAGEPILIGNVLNTVDDAVIPVESAVVRITMLHNTGLNDRIGNHRLAFGGPSVPGNIDLGNSDDESFVIGARANSGYAFAGLAQAAIYTGAPPGGGGPGLVIEPPWDGTHGQVAFSNGDGTSTTLRIRDDELGFFDSLGTAKPTVTGSRGGNAALASLLTALANLGLITDSTSA